MKKIIILILALFTIFTLASCNEVSESSITSQSVSSINSESSSIDTVERGITFSEYEATETGVSVNIQLEVISRTDFIPTRNVDTRYVVEGEITTIIGLVNGHEVEVNQLQISEIDTLYLQVGSSIYIRGEKDILFGDVFINEPKLVKIYDFQRIYEEEAIDSSLVLDTMTVDVQNGDLESDTVTYTGELGTTTVTRDQYYIEWLDVAFYIYIFKQLPRNYMMKEDTYHDTDYEMIGGNCFNENPDPSRPVDGQFTELDVDNYGSGRGTTRIVFSRDMDKHYIYHTVDHYETYTLILFNA